MRNYGFWVENKKEPGADGVQIQAVFDSTLAKVTNLKYRGFDPDYPDVKRAQTFLDDLAQFGSTNQMPALILMRLGNRRQRRRARDDCRWRVSQQVLGEHRDFCYGSRRAEQRRTGRPRFCSPRTRTPA